MTLQTYMRGADPFFYTGTSGVGCLVVHGFMSSPREVRWLGASLAAQGHTVYGVRLAGHGIDPALMHQLRWEQWLASVRDAYHLLQAQHQHVFLVGHSLGGLLSLLLSTQVEVAGVAVLAAPITYSPMYHQFVKALAYIRPMSFMPDQTGLEDYIKNEQVRLGEPPLGRVRYNQWSVGAISQLYEAIACTQTQLTHVKAPLLLVYSQNDQTVPSTDAAMVAEGVSSTLIEQHMLVHSGHNLPQDQEREQIFAWVGEFIAKLG